MENGLTMFIYCELEASLGYPAMAPLPRILRAGTLEPVPRPLHSLGRENLASKSGSRPQTFISNEIAGFVLGKNVFRRSSGVGGMVGGMSDGVAAAALVLERTSAGAGGVAADVLRFVNRL